MAYIEKNSMLQNVDKDMQALFEEHGWEMFLRYRLYNKKGTPSKFADVRLFRSMGSDNELRYFGMVYGYDTLIQQFNDNRYIFQDSNLGLVDIGDGEKREFQLKVYPVDVTDHVYIYNNQALVPEAGYSLDYARGAIVFNEAPGVGDVITASYHLATTAPEPATRFVFFTFNAVYLEKLSFDGSPLQKIGDGDDVTVNFYTPTAPVKLNTLKVYIDSILQPTDTYKVNLSTGLITFNTPPTLGKEITVEYTQILNGETNVKSGDGDGNNRIFYSPSAPIAENTLIVYVQGNKKTKGVDYEADLETGKITFMEGKQPGLGHEVTLSYTSLAGGAVPTGAQMLLNDIAVNATFDPLNTTSLMSAVYESMFFLNPSLPTAMSLSKDRIFERSLQRDSLIHYWGQINKDRIVLFFRPDPSGGPESTYFSPLYIGRLLLQGKAPAKNMVIISGCSEADEIKWKQNLKLGVNLVDYGKDTTNGNSTVLLSQTLGGSYYQHHYLAFITHDIDADNGDGRFNPSVYTNRYHFSRVFIVHPNDGYVGELDDVYAVHPKSIYQQDLLEIEEKVQDELVGVGNSQQRIYHARRTPKSGTLVVKVGCEQLSASDYTFDEETKAITFKVPPATGEEVLLSYEMEQVYQFTLPTTPRTPYRLKTASPYAPIGLAVLKENRTN